MRKAWNLTRFQAPDDPALYKNLYDINAILPDNTSPEDFRLMIQGLLKSRFHLTARIEKKLSTVYVLSVAPGGLRMKEAEAARTGTTSAPAPTGRPQAPQYEFGKDGRSQLVPGTKAIVTFGGDGVNHVLARLQTVTDLAHFLETRLGNLIRDETGLLGTYDFVLEFSKDGPGGRMAGAPFTGAPTEAPVPAPDLFGALRQQLGLTLKASKEPLDVLVVDSYNPIPEGN